MKYGRNVRQALILVTQFSIDMLVPIVICSCIGGWLDGKLGTSWIFVLMFFVGALAGGGNVYRSARRVFGSSSGDIRNRDNASKEDSSDETHK